MSTIEEQLAALRKLRDASGAELEKLPNGSHIVRIPNFQLPDGWKVKEQPERRVTILFLAPPGYPGSQPDCFWVAPIGLRLSSDAMPAGANDTTLIPGYATSTPPGTWFSWHVQQWNPNTDSLVSYFMVIKKRFSTPK